MRVLGLVGLLLSVVLIALGFFNATERARRQRAIQEQALHGAVEDVSGRVLGSERQMVTAASQMLVNPAVLALLEGRAHNPAQRVADHSAAASALGTFATAAIVPVTSACLDDVEAHQLACSPSAGAVVFPAALRRTFDVVAGATDWGLPTPKFRSPVTGRLTGAFIVPLRLGGSLLGLVHYDMESGAVEGSSLLSRDIAGVRVKLAVVAGERIVGGAWGPVGAATRVHDDGTAVRWMTTIAGRPALVSTLPLAIGRTGLMLGVIAATIASRPTIFNVWTPAMVAVLVLAVVMLAGSVATLAVAGRRTARELCTDPLTRLRNRRALMEELPRVCQRASEEQPAFLWFFDLDGFKSYNDAFGHPAGDALLARLGARLQDAVRPHGAVYRLGGDEFCALLADPVVDPHALFQGAREALCEHGGAFTVTASAGAVEIPREAAEATQALRIADQHMYRDKASGRSGPADLITAVLHAALAQRHPELDEHSSDVAGDVELLARAVGLEEEAVQMIIRAGDLHDVGKLGIPDEIIAKPGPLNDHEWEFMRQHTVMGERIIAAAGPSLERIAPLVRASHERWDGGGYPDGLAGEEIPLGARIITICDSFRAMLDERPYKPAMAMDDALAELRRCAGTQFDPELVLTFCRLLAERPAAPARDGASPA